jgi:hypothetical protein
MPLSISSNALLLRTERIWCEARGPAAKEECVFSISQFCTALLAFKVIAIFLLRQFADESCARITCVSPDLA